MIARLRYRFWFAAMDTVDRLRRWCWRKAVDAAEWTVCFNCRREPEDCECTGGPLLDLRAD